MLASHPVAAYGSEVYDNIYHVPPEELLSRDISSTSLRLWLANLRSNHRERELLRASEANFRGIFNAVSDAIFIRDIDTFEFVDANQRAQEMFGVTLEEIKQCPPGFLHAEVLPGQPRRISSPSWKKQARDSPRQSSGWPGPGMAGPSGWRATWYAAVIGGQERIISTVRDISQRKRAEEALREATEYLNNLITYANAPIIVWDPERKITRFNHAFEHLTGYSEEEVMGRDLELLFPLDSSRGIARQDRGRSQRRALGIGGDTHTDQGRRSPHGPVELGQHLRGRRRDAAGHHRPGPGHHERKRVEKQLQAVNRELSEYAHTISHDLHAPISTIHGYAQVAEEAYTDGNGSVLIESLGAIRRLTERMGSMVKAILEYAEADKMEGRAEMVSLGEALLEVLADHEGDIRSREMELALQEELPIVLVDHIRLRQVLTNIIGNAVKFTAGWPEPRISVGAEEKGGWATVSIGDNGAGIEPGAMDGIFVPFRTFQGDGSSGHGIGLATARKVVEGWGGKIWAESEPGGGSTFFFTVPAAHQ